MRVPGAAGWRQALAPSANRCRAAGRDTPRASAMWFQDLPRARADDVPDVCLSGAVPSPWLADPHLDNSLVCPARWRRRPGRSAAPRHGHGHPPPGTQTSCLAPRPCPNLLDRLAGPRSWGSITNDLSIRVPARGTRRSVGAPSRGGCRIIAWRWMAHGIQTESRISAASSRLTGCGDAGLLHDLGSKGIYPTATARTGR